MENNLLKLEEKRQEIGPILWGSISPRYKLFVLTEFIEELCKSDNKNLIEAYFAEFLDEYLALLKIYELTGLEPIKTELIISTLHKIIGYNLFNEYRDKFLLIEESLSQKFNGIKSALLENELTNSEHLYFPVLEYYTNQNGESGFLESLEIKIHKTGDKKEDIFFIIPSGEKIEKRLNDQIKSSWKVAIDFVAEKSIKISSYHEVVISFDKKYGEYVGNSLGLVLTLGFIEELLRLYQTRDIIKIKSGIAISGGVQNNGIVIPLSEKIICTKVEVAFFSTINYLVVPKENEGSAVETLSSLQLKYPKRNLKIIGVISVWDLIDRRSLINIGKTNIAVFTAKKIYKYKYSFALLLLFLFITGYFLGHNYDNNPDSLDISNNILSVKNKYGNILWQEHVNYDKKTLSNVPYIARIFDVNNSGKNDVILTSESLNELHNKKEFGRVACFNYKHKLLWEYTFRKRIDTKVENFSPFYSLKILAINNDIHEPEILLVGQHINFYPSPIFRLRLKDGKRIGPIFWHPGGGSWGLLTKSDRNGKDELIATSISNGFERCVLYSIDYYKLKGTAPTTSNYRFLNQPIADFNQYIILPKSDLNRYYDERYNFLSSPPIITYDTLIYFSLAEEKFSNESDASLGYEFYKNLKFKDVIIGDKFRSVRDSLVAEGKIKGPYTETPAYHKYLRDQIKYWDGTKFVSINNLKWIAKGKQK